jgi:hypothetical protein
MTYNLNSTIPLKFYNTFIRVSYGIGLYVNKLNKNENTVHLRCNAAYDKLWKLLNCFFVIHDRQRYILINTTHLPTNTQYTFLLKVENNKHRYRVFRTRVTRYFHMKLSGDVRLKEAIIASMELGILPYRVVEIIEEKTCTGKI